MKLLTVAVPCYNSEAYLDHCLETLLSAGRDEVEILIVNDGSKDRTGAMADDYARRFPGTVRALHQENGGHGEAVNAGIRNAAGLYFKVVDSDDWVDTSAWIRVLAELEAQAGLADPADLIVTNFVYDKVGVEKKKVMHYRGLLPAGRTVTWDQTRPFGLGRYFMMHSLMYRTQVLRDCGLELPKHTFYVDNLFVYVPLDAVKTLRYVDENLYRYFIGRADQSVNEAVMIKRLDQQIKVNRLVLFHQRLADVAPPRLRQMKYHQVEIVTVITLILLIRSGLDPAGLRAQALWDEIRSFDPDLARRLRGGLLGRLLTLPGRPGRAVAIAVYRAAQAVFGFN